MTGKTFPLLLLMFVALVSTAVFAQNTLKVSIDDRLTMQAGGWFVLRFTNTNEMTTANAYEFAWDNPPFEANRLNACLIASSNDNNYVHLAMGLNRRSRFCYYANSPNHALSTSPNYAATLTFGNACTETRQSAFKINPLATIPANSEVVCYLETATTKVAPPNSQLIPFNPNNNANLDFVISNPADAIFTISNAKSQILKSVYLGGRSLGNTHYAADKWSFKLTLTSTRTGIMRLTSLPSNTYGFDTSIYSDGPSGSFWCSGKNARVVPVPSTFHISQQWINIYFIKANVTTDCIFRLQPLDTNLITTSPEAKVRLHQQPLFSVFNITADMVPYNAQTQLSAVGTSPETVKWGSFARVSFPIPIDTPVNSQFRVKFKTLSGSINAATLLPALTIASQNAKVGVALDEANKDSLTVTFAGDQSTAFQYASVDLTLTQKLTATGKLDYEIEFIDNNNIVLNKKQTVTCKFQTPLTTTWLKATVIPDALVMRVQGKYTADYFTASSGHYLRIASLYSQYFQPTGNSCQAYINDAKVSSTIIEKMGVFYIKINADLPPGQVAEVDCDMSLFVVAKNVDTYEFNIFAKAFPADYYVFDHKVLDGENGTPKFTGFGKPASALQVTASSPENPKPAFEMLATPIDPVTPPTGSMQLFFQTRFQWDPVTSTIKNTIEPQVNKIIKLIKNVDLDGTKYLPTLSISDVVYNIPFNRDAAPAQYSSGTEQPGDFLHSTGPNQYGTPWQSAYYTIDLSKWMNETTAANTFRTALNTFVKAKVAEGVLTSNDVVGTDPVGIAPNTDFATYCAQSSNYGLARCMNLFPGQSCRYDSSCSTQMCSPFSKTCVALDSEVQSKSHRLPSANERFSPTSNLQVFYSNGVTFTTTIAIVLAVVVAFF